MTICSIPGLRTRSKTCLSACCYVDSWRVIFETEIGLVGEENVIEKDNRYYIKNKGDFSACALLDEEKLLCELGEKRPFWCKQHNCSRDLKNYPLHHQEVKYYRQKKLNSD